MCSARPAAAANRTPEVAPWFRCIASYTLTVAVGATIGVPACGGRSTPQDASGSVLPDSSDASVSPDEADASSASDAGQMLDASGPLDSGSSMPPFKLIHRVPPTAVAAAEELLRLGLECIAQASALAGSVGVVTTGTLRETAAGLVYGAEPTDRLVFVRAQGASVTFVVEPIEGTLSTPEDFSSHDHQLQLHAIAEGHYDLELTSARLGAKRTGDIVGTIEIEGSSVGVDLDYAAENRFTSDSVGTEYENVYTLSGTARAADWTLTVVEDGRFDLVSSRGPSGAATSTSDVRHIQSTWLFEGAQFAYEDVVLKKAFREGKPVEEGFWRCSGAVTRNGQVIGEYQKEGHLIDTQRGGFIFFGLRVGDAWTEFERWNAY